MRIEVEISYHSTGHSSYYGRQRIDGPHDAAQPVEPENDARGYYYRIAIEVQS